MRLVRLSIVCEHLLASQLCPVSLTQSRATQISHVRTKISQPNLRIDCYNSSIRQIRRLQNMTIKTQPKTAFGKTLHYVTDPVQAQALSSLTGKKTINEKDIANLKTLGIAVESQQTQVATMVYA